MNKPKLTALTLLLTAALSACSSSAQTTTPTTPGPTVAMPADAQTNKVVDAANAFLATLSAAQKTAVSFAWTDSAQRARWSNFPTGIFQRDGVKWGDMSEAQRTALTTLLGTVLSTDGLEMVQQQMAADDILKAQGGGNLQFGSDEYYVSFLGTPSATTAWTLQFGGHHLAINATVAGADITLAPSLTGGQPIYTTINGQTVTVVEDVPQEVKDATALLASLDAAQQAKAIISTKSIDLVLGPGQDGKTLQAEGLPGSAMTAAQKTAFLILITERLNALNADDLAPKLAEIEKNLDSTYFAWYGPTTSDGNFYYRVTGPTVLVEYSPQSMGGNAANHIHSMYRDPTDDYGAALVK